MIRSLCSMSLMLLLFCLNASAQTKIGISLNLGNRQQFHPSSKGFKRSLAPSGNLFINQEWKLKQAWRIQAGVTVGVVAYKLNVIAIDTLTPSGNSTSFPDYSTLFASAEILPGRHFSVGKKRLTINAGAGITFYTSTIPINKYGIHIGYPDGSLLTIFDARISAPANTFSPFWKVAAYYNLTKAFSIGAEYVHHTLPAAKGTYAFYHSRTPQSGNIEIFQREFRIAFAYVLRK